MSCISDVIKKDQQEMRNNYQHIIEAQDNETKERWGNQFVWELARYTVAEELIVYPALESHMDHGKIIADKDRNENRQIKEMLAQFQEMSPSDPRYRPTLDSIMTKLNKHIDEEQEEDLPSLESVLDPPESQQISRRFERTKILMPTRAHPNAPTQPYFETAAAFMQAPMDRIADIMWREFPEY
ncbi:hypothetical protein LOZ61_005376 [Ophidiomyces ophidiicola]|uniref:Uncharacterized protein n=1 Tax=Ophidiomyces ophidiicola TaxID=1387563 RepID=A0ACB8UTF0_9EURO|nr:hypothetical protein LOZ61_005376 [Ophidiomyces ophidiicola]KAI1920848.1 hypothetical protein LOZ60_006480 [Ophidiomyces ophidiicola]KAI1955544.1 hypothetical protein LOZ59_004536 [Ophidiomyces ophidiicola]KAI1965533.1 hypothetical protein LOZ56_006034 [Ophidiomyces ophidiicola]KAI2005041.1 hypothetical protein LOZ50_003932 [Ophidiomyces ophidiicola]